MPSWFMPIRSSIIWTKGRCFSGGPGDGGEVLGVAQHGVEALPHLLADFPGQIHGALANAPLGHVDDAPQPDFIGGVVDDAQIGNHVSDLFAVEEAGAADDAVGDALLGEHALQGLGLGIHPVEHGEVARTSGPWTPRPKWPWRCSRPRPARFPPGAGRFSPQARRRSKGSCPCGSWLLAMTALAASRMFWVER